MAPTGFPTDGLAFFRDLAAHNKPAWFEEHRKVWDEGIVPAMAQLCTELQERVRDVLPRLTCQPRVGGSLMRLNRDVRFSRDKSPFETHAACVLWDGPEKQGSPGFTVQIGPGEVRVTGGVGIFEEEGALDRWRKRVALQISGEKLDEALAHAKKAGLLPDALEKIPRVPRGLPPEHARAELLKFKGLTVSRAHKPGAWVATGELLDRVEAAARGYAPVHDWLCVEVMGR